MLIRIQRQNGTYDYIKNTMLDDLLETNSVRQFRRQTGWVDVTVGPLRKTRR